MSSRQTKVNGEILAVNSWNWHIAFQSVLIAVVACTFIDITQLANGKLSDQGQYGLTNTVRSLRRFASLNTYTILRGQYLVGDIYLHDPIDVRGIQAVEDSIGGILTGPEGLWKHGHVDVSVRPEQEFPPVIELQHLHKVNRKWWTNGNKDYCVDREIFLSGEDFPNMELTTEHGQTSVTYLGYLHYSCEHDMQEGFISTIYTAHHGGAIVGRVFKMKALLSHLEMPENATSTSISVPCELEELGAFVEDRGFTSRWNDYIKMMVILLPLVAWSFIKSRIARALVVLQSMSAKSGNSVAISGYVDNAMIDTWGYPLSYILLSIVLLSQSSVMHQNELYTVQKVVPLYKTYGPDMIGCALFCIAQELVAWLCFTYSFFTTQEIVYNLNKGVVYGYQRCESLLSMICYLNYLGALVVLFDSLRLIPADYSFLSYLIISILVVVLNLGTVLYGYFNHPYDSPKNLILVGISYYSSINNRGIANLLNQQQKDRFAHEELMMNELEGASFRGDLIDALMLLQPSMMFEAFLNGIRIEMKILERATDVHNMPAQIKVRDNGNFELLRHSNEIGDSTIVLG